MCEQDPNAAPPHPPASSYLHPMGLRVNPQTVKWVWSGGKQKKERKKKKEKRYEPLIKMNVLQ